MGKTTHMVSRVVAMAVTIVAGILGANAADSPAQEHVVEITGLEFIPETIEVNPGDTVTWVNRDIVPHTASSNDGSWDTGTLSQNESKSLIVSQNMTSAYHCRFHINMTGRLL